MPARGRARNERAAAFGFSEAVERPQNAAHTRSKSPLSLTVSSP